MTAHIEALTVEVSAEPGTEHVYTGYWVAADDADRDLTISGSVQGDTIDETYSAAKYAAEAGARAIDRMREEAA